MLVLFAYGLITLPPFPVATSPAQIHDKEPLSIILIKKSEWSATPFTVNGHILYLFHVLQLTPEVLKNRFLCSSVDSKAFIPQKTNPCCFNVGRFYPYRTVYCIVHCSVLMYKAETKLGCRNLKARRYLQAVAQTFWHRHFDFIYILCLHVLIFIDYAFRIWHGTCHYPEKM